MTPRSLATYFAARALPALTTMGLTFLCIHLLPSEQYAVYSLALLAVGVASGFVGGISGQAMLRYSHELSPQALRRGLVGFPLLASALACPVVLTYLWWTGGASAVIWLATASIPLLALMDTRRSLFIAGGRADAVFCLDATRAGLALLLALALLRVWSAEAAAPMLAQWLAVVTCLLLVRPGHRPASPAGTRAVDAEYVRYGVGIAGWMAVIVALSLAERSVVADVLGLDASGRYAAPADVINAAFSATAGAVGAAMMPAYLAQTRSPDAKALRRLLRLGLLGVGAIAVLCLLIGAVLATAGVGRIAQALIGDLPTAVALVAAAAVWAAAGFVQKPIELRGNTWPLFSGVAFALLLFLLIAPVLAARLGSAGVALSKLAVGLVYCGLAWAMARRAP